MIATTKAVTNSILVEDMEAIFNGLSVAEKEKLRNSTILLTGCGGFLGYYFMHFFAHYAEELQLKKIIALENFLTGTKDWLSSLVESDPELITWLSYTVYSSSAFLRSSASTRLFHLITLFASASTSMGIMTPICFAV